ncbi:hypothetical protein GBAR_LOCUS22481 [Geodia barretti]|uniref:Uncharacterized protein n=1 Tax=Geodia barretti TaxID=519541 RepID=A0AA35T218_GEOBA|nr:hypothetical protein GBAR_LOCUS22481 [Geodia barretti]
MNATHSVCVLVIVLCSFQPILSQQCNAFATVGGVIGGLIFIVVISVLLCCVCYHCKRHQMRQSSAVVVTTTPQVVSDFPAGQFH